MQRSQFLAYYKKQYVAQNIVVGLAGNYNKQKAVQLIRRYFGQAKGGQASKRPAVKERQTEPKVSLHYKKTDQSHICLGVRGYNLLHKDRHALRLLANILGGNMSSRLFMNLREKAGLAYYVRTTAEGNPETGYLVTQAGVPNQKIAQAINIIQAEYRKTKKDISASDLKRAKNYIKGKILLSLESSDELASHYIAQELLEDRILPPREQFKLIDKVTVADVKRVARDIFVDEKLNLAVIGPFKDSRLFLRELKL